jgi:HK97 gp10 family phage protein
MARFRYDGARLRAYQASLPDRGTRAETRIAKNAVQNIKRRAPVDTGELRDSIHQEGGLVVATANHAGFVEFGTYKMAAQPYFIPGLEATRGDFIAIAAQEFKP